MARRSENGTAYDRRQQELWDQWAAKASPEDLKACLHFREQQHAELLEQHGTEMKASLSSLDRIRKALHSALNGRSVPATSPNLLEPHP